MVWVLVCMCSIIFSSPETRIWEVSGGSNAWLRFPTWTHSPFLLGCLIPELTELSRAAEQGLPPGRFALPFTSPYHGRSLPTWTQGPQRDLDLSPPSLKGKQEAATPGACIYPSYLSKRFGRSYRDMTEPVHASRGGQRGPKVNADKDAAEDTDEIKCITS